MEERISLLAQQVATMMADVTTLQSELAGSGAQFAELTVRLVTNDPRIRRIFDASEETATIVSRVQALEARSADTATTSPMRFWSKEASDFKPNVWTGEKMNESFAAFKMELQNWVGALHDKMLKVMELGETKKGRITEADVRNAGTSQDTISDLKRDGSKAVPASRRVHKGRSKELCLQHRKVRVQSRKLMVSHFDPRTGADRSVAYSRVTHPVSPSGITPTKPKTLQSSRTTMQAWEQEVAEFEIKYAKRVDEDAKILAPKSTMPETLFVEAGVFRGRSFNTYAELRTSIIRYLDDKVPVSPMTKSSSSSVTKSFVESEKTKRKTKTASRKKNYLPWFSSSGMVRAKARARAKAKESAGTVAMVITTAEIARTTSWKGHQDSRNNKGSSKGWDTGKSNWNSAQGKVKEWQPYGKWSSTTGMFGSKGKGSIYNVDGILTLQTLKKIFISASWNIPKMS